MDTTESLAHKELLDVAEALLEYIDALPKDLALPNMPGLDHDWINMVILDSKFLTKDPDYFGEQP